MVHKSEEIDIRWMHPQRQAHAEVREQNACCGGVDVSKSIIGSSSEGESRGDRDDFAMEGQTLRPPEDM